MIDLLPKNIPYANVKRLHIKKQCFKQLINFVTREYAVSKNDLKYNKAIEIFAEKNNFIIPKNISAKKWILTVFLDENITFFGSHIVTKRKKTKLKNLKYKSYKDFLQSTYWKEVRAMVLKRDENKCGCGAKFNLQIHHLTYRNHLNEKSHLEDLITVCRKCHEKIHNK